jgi:GNAT superfamily N-acetyltransferase
MSEVGETMRCESTLPLADGRWLAVRRGGAGDLALVRALHERCSPTTLHRRYLSAGPVSDTQLRRLLTPARGACLLVEEAPGRAVAMANLIGEGVQAEAALLVEDGWQRSGLGTALLHLLLEMADEANFKSVVVCTGAGNEAMLRTLRRLDPGAPRERDGALVVVTLRPGRAAARSAVAVA